MEYTKGVTVEDRPDELERIVEAIGGATVDQEPESNSVRQALQVILEELREIRTALAHHQKHLELLERKGPVL